jgi:hypothetical protein
MGQHRHLFHVRIARKRVEQAFQRIARIVGAFQIIRVGAQQRLASGRL